MEKSGSRERRRSQLSALQLLSAAGLLLCGCARAPLSPSPARMPQPAPRALVVTTHAASTLGAPEPVHAAPDAQVESGERDEEAEEDESELETEGEVSEPESYDAVFSEVEVERYEEKESGVTFGPMALYSALMLQHVGSYDNWRAAFDAQLPARKRAGFASQAVLRGVYDAKLVAVWLAATDVGLAKSYLSEVQHGKPAAKSGKPRVLLARNLASKLESRLQGLHAAFVTLEVEDLQGFRDAFEADARRRLTHGIAGYALSQDLDDEALIYVYLQSEAAGHLKSYIASPETRRIWHEAGVTNVKSSIIVREGELSLCQ